MMCYKEHLRDSDLYNDDSSRSDDNAEETRARHKGSATMQLAILPINYTSPVDVEISTGSVHANGGYEN